MERIFSPQELKENDQRKESLIQLMNTGEGILMIGAGCSASIYPDWFGFIKSLYEEAVRYQNNFPAFDAKNHDFLTYADEVKRCIGSDRFYHIVFHCFSPGDKTHERFHEVLCSFLEKGKIKGITTTNYDTVLESALTSVSGKHRDSVRIDDRIAKAMIFEFMFSLNKGKVPKRIFHLHGIYNEPESIILCGSEYEEKYGFKLKKPPDTLFQTIKQGAGEQEFLNYLNAYGLVWTPHRKILWSLFATRRLIFLGFSLTDPYFKKMLESVSEDLHTYGYVNHFLVLRVKDEEEKKRALLRAEELKKDYGIETVLFEEDEKNGGLSNFVFELESVLNETSDPVQTKEVNKRQETIYPQQVQDEDEDLTDKLINISRKNDYGQ